MFRTAVLAAVMCAAGFMVPGQVHAQMGAKTVPTEVDVALVLAVDISASIDEDEARLQRQGYADALSDPAVLKAIATGPLGRIAVVYFEWSSDSDQQVVAPWTVIGDSGSAAVFSAALAEAPLRIGQFTSISSAIDFSLTLFDASGVEALRQVIDISGDGFNNSGRSLQAARERALARGITINGLPVMNDRPNPGGGGKPPAGLDRYYEDNVIGGPGAFVTPAHDFDDFGRAVRAKLIREIAGTPVPAPTLAARPE
ncbi:MAG TPA: DUF1194 domain-containing protein [Azospirillaceae bacterium]|nr:DUF1194 domain-containing protein [Azospirillaceae bacterium]